MLRNIFFTALGCYPNAFYIQKRANFIPEKCKESLKCGKVVYRSLGTFGGFKAIGEKK